MTDVLETYALTATRVTPFVRDWWRCSTVGTVRVHQVFARACNLINAQGEIVSLVTPELGPGPFAMVVPRPRPWTEIIIKDSRVRLESDRLCVGTESIDTTTAELWFPRPNWECVRRDTAVWQERRRQMQATLAARRLPLQPDEEQARLIQTKLAEAAALLRQGLLAADANTCRRAAVRLAGLGPGLTPSGDDYLLGAIYGLWATRPPEQVQFLASLLVETAVPRTTTLSGAWLQAAARGEAAAPWHDLLVSGPEWREGMARILATGHSSGADALAGFTAMLADE